MSDSYICTVMHLEHPLPLVSSPAHFNIHSEDKMYPAPNLPMIGYKHFYHAHHAVCEQQSGQLTMWVESQATFKIQGHSSLLCSQRCRVKYLVLAMQNWKYHA